MFLCYQIRSRSDHKRIVLKHLKLYGHRNAADWLRDVVLKRLSKIERHTLAVSRQEFLERKINLYRTNESDFIR